MLPKHLAIACLVYFGSVGFSAVTDAWNVRSNGIGPLRVGMTVGQLNATLHESFAIPDDKEERQCYYVSTGRRPGISFMIQGQRFVRVDVDDRNTATAEGIRIGDSEARVKQVYGPKLEVEPNHYDPQDDNLTIHSADHRYGIRFETDNGKITSFYAGSSSAIELIEGCS
jgi:hypothetical protein